MEKRISQYRQITGDNFLVNLREVLQSQKKVVIQVLLKKSVNVGEENTLKQSFAPDKFMTELENGACDVETLDLSFE